MVGRLGIRRTLVAVLVSVVLWLFSSGASDATEARIALVIGNGAYERQPFLKNPPNDARLIAATLKRLGFTVIGPESGEPLINANLATMRNSINTFIKTLTEAGTDSVALFYYAGHAAQDDGKNYLFPVDADITKNDNIENVAVSADSILSQVSYVRPRVQVLILDACRTYLPRGLARSPTRGLAKMSAPSGTLIAYATAPGSEAQDGLGDNSPYSKALAAAMTQPNMPIEDMFKSVRVSVMNATGQRQVPWEASSLVGNFYFRQDANSAASSLPPVISDLGFTGLSHETVIYVASGPTSSPELRAASRLETQLRANGYQLANTRDRDTADVTVEVAMSKLAEPSCRPDNFQCEVQLEATFSSYRVRDHKSVIPTRSIIQRSTDKSPERAWQRAADLAVSSIFNNFIAPETR